MKALYHYSRLLSVIFLLPFLILSSCKDDSIETKTYHMFIPSMISVTDLRSQVNFSQVPEPLSIPGKIYIYGNYLFISEVNRGIHVVDNSNPTFPRFISFINIPGNADMAISDNILYADSYVDLLAFNISKPGNIQHVKRVTDVFEKFYANKAKGIIYGLKDTVVSQRIDEGNSVGGRPMFFEANSSNLSSKSYGTGGSTARFTLMNDYLYTVDNSKLKLFDVAVPSNPSYLSSINIGWGIETIFPYENKLFIGSTTGMHIFDASKPSAPFKLSTYRHVTSCDPVIVQGKYAYVTLRSGNFCQQGVNVLDVLNIEDPTKPVLVSSFPMLNPHGLGISNNDLFICEGENGLKAFKNTDVLKIGDNQRSFIRGINAKDVITGPKSLIVTGDEGVYQYNYANSSALKLLSKITLDNNL